MALASRTPRRGGAGSRWIAAGVVITLLVLLINASLNSRSDGPVQQLAAGTWVDKVLPIITSSNAEGRVLQSVWSGGLQTPAAQVASEVSTVAAVSNQDYANLVKLRAPAALSGAAGLLETSLLVRSRAATNLDKAFSATLGAASRGPGPPVVSGPTTVATSAGSTTTTTSTVPPPPASPPATVVPEVTSAGSEIQMGDLAYQLFLSSLPASFGVRMPPSAWAADLGPYGAQAAQVFLSTLQSRVVTTPLHQIRILAVTTNPPPVSTGAVETLPDASSMTLGIVLADTGNQAESDLTVTATISPNGRGYGTVRQPYVNLAVGQAYSINDLGPLLPPLGTPVTLTVTVTGPSGSTTTLAQKVITFQMPAPPPPTTTTTSTTSTTSTTTPRG